MRIIGPPGTGKTTWLQKKVEELHTYYHNEEITMTSFTKAAARVLSERIEGGNCGTLHSLCYENLSKPAIAETKIADWNAKHPKWALSKSKKNVDDMALEEQFATDADSLMASIQIKRNKMETLNQREKVLYDLWYQWKYDNDLFDFTDMIEHNLEAVDSAPGNPRVLIVDEAQDLTRLEAALVKKWSRETDMFFVAGDSDQCLYSFKGASPHDFIDLDSDVNILNQSYRVPICVHDFAVSIIKRIKDREDVEYLPQDRHGFVTNHHETYMSNLSEMIKSDLSNNNTVMLLTSCGYMIDSVKDMLRNEKIPFHNPYRLRRGDWNPVRLGSSVGDMLAFFKKDHLSFLSWQRHLKRSCFNKGIKEQLEGLEKDKKRIDYVWSHYVGDELKKNFGNCQWYIDNCLSTKKKSLAYPKSLIDRYGEDIEPKVIIGTIHSVKGGEADVVYLFPDLSTASARNKDDSLHRMFYVGATRAREGLRIFNTQGRNFYEM